MQDLFLVDAGLCSVVVTEVAPRAASQGLGKAADPDVRGDRVELLIDDPLVVVHIRADRR